MCNENNDVIRKHSMSYITTVINKTQNAWIKIAGDSTWNQYGVKQHMNKTTKNNAQHNNTNNVVKRVPAGRGLHDGFHLLCLLLYSLFQ